MQVKEWIRLTAQTLVDDADQVSVNEVSGSQATVFELKVARGDIGKIIGKRGRTADAMRSVLLSLSAKYGRRYSLEIVDS